MTGPGSVLNNPSQFYVPDNLSGPIFDQNLFFTTLQSQLGAYDAAPKVPSPDYTQRSSKVTLENMKSVCAELMNLAIGGDGTPGEFFPNFPVQMGAQKIDIDNVRPGLKQSSDYFALQSRSSYGAYLSPDMDYDSFVPVKLVLLALATILGTVIAVSVAGGIAKLF